MIGARIRTLFTDSGRLYAFGSSVYRDIHIDPVPAIGAAQAEIIAQAGRPGVVTIATNMAGRGVDIKLGGELAEEINSAISRILRRNNFDSAYDMSLDEKHTALLTLVPEDYGIYMAEVDYFLKYIDDMT